MRNVGRDYSHAAGVARRADASTMSQRRNDPVLMRPRRKCSISRLQLSTNHVPKAIVRRQEEAWFVSDQESIPPPALVSSSSLAWLEQFVKGLVQLVADGLPCGVLQQLRGEVGHRALIELRAGQRTADGHVQHLAFQTGQ